MASLPTRRKVRIEVERQVSTNKYPHSLQMYIEPPSGDVKLEEMREWCANRLRVLKLVEQISMKNCKVTSKQCLFMLIDRLERIGLCKFARLISANDSESQGETEQNLRRNDCISHFLLRSVFAFEYEQRKWFFTQEVKLFTWRISALDDESIGMFKRINGLQYETISEEEKRKLKENLLISCSDSEDIDSIKFYKVNFTNVLCLVERRQIFLKDGIAYVPETRMSSLILNDFKNTLNRGFRYSRETASNVYDDERLTEMFSALRKCVNLNCFKYNQNQVFINELDELSRTSYPLCMRVLHETLKAKHHLTNGGRVQYCLFLKGIGLSANDALKFWKNEFLKKIDERTFNRQYKYGIRHLYGLEGKRANYDPFPCFKILESSIGLRDHHGCPFKHFNPEVLREMLSKYGLLQFDVESIVQLSKEGSYFQACKKYFESNHNDIVENVFDHPNAYFAHSRYLFENAYSDYEEN